MSTDSRKALQLFFGYDTFLDNQESIIDDILAGNDLCVIMPTGAGKSLCSLLPRLRCSSHSADPASARAGTRHCRSGDFASRDLQRKRFRQNNRLRQRAALSRDSFRLRRDMYTPPNVLISSSDTEFSISCWIADSSS